MLLRVALLLAVLCYTGAGCGLTGDNRDPAQTPSADMRQTPTPTGSPSPPLSATELPTLTPPTAPPTTPSDQLAPITVAGTIEGGRPDGCVFLVTDLNVRYALTGGRAANLTIGSTVKLRGMPTSVEVSSCSGIVLTVVEVLASAVERRAPSS